MLDNAEDIKKQIADYESKYGVSLNPDLLKIAASKFQKSDPISWSMKYRNLKGKPYRFELPLDKRGDKKLWNTHRPFLKQFIADQSKSKCSQKSRQSGMSESSVTEAGWFAAEHPSVRVVYTFPSGKQMNDFSNGRIDPLFDESDYLNSLKGEVFNVGMKQVGKNSFIYLRSASTGRLGEGIDADVVFFDEKDRMAEGVEDAFRQSLSSSAYGYLREFSTPSLPGRGINKSFNRAKQYYWFVKCNSGHRQTLSYPDNIGFHSDLDPTSEYLIPGTTYFKCSHIGFDGVPCPSAINRWEGEWVVKNNDHVQDNVGYHINQLSCVWLDSDYIIQEKIRMKWPDLFYNYVLGEVYSSNDGLITEDALRACMDRTRRSIPHLRMPNYVQVVVGIDWGSLNWCIILGKRLDGLWEVCGFKYVEDDSDVLSAAKKLGDYIEPFRPNLIVADLGYGRDRCQYLLNRFPERVFACTYTNTENDKQFNAVWAQDRVSVNRTAHLRNMLENIKSKRIVFPGTEEEYKIIFKHIMTLVLVHIEEDTPNREDTLVIEKIEHTGPDHCAHAMAYACLGAEKLKENGQFSWSFI